MTTNASTQTDPHTAARTDAVATLLATVGAIVLTMLMGLTLLSYATNLFIFGMGRLALHRAPIIDAAAGSVDPALYPDPVPQALVLTAIVIGFATTALFLVVLLALRGLTGTDHVDGREPGA